MLRTLGWVDFFNLDFSLDFNIDFYLDFYLNFNQDSTLISILIFICISVCAYLGCLQNWVELEIGSPGEPKPPGSIPGSEELSLIPPNLVKMYQVRQVTNIRYIRIFRLKNLKTLFWEIYLNFVLKSWQTNLLTLCHFNHRKLVTAGCRRRCLKK